MADERLVWAEGVAVRRTARGFVALRDAAPAPIDLPPLSVRILAAFCEPADAERVAVVLAQRFGAPAERIAAAIAELHEHGLLVPLQPQRVERPGRVRPPFPARAPQPTTLLVDVLHRTLYDLHSALD